MPVAELIVGPLLRYAGERDATVWVETDVACEVQVLGHQARTFHVAGHHYALVAITGLAPGESREYGVALDGERRWPAPGSSLPASQIRTLDRERALSVVFGSCRAAAPHEWPYVLERTEHRLGRGVDALQALAHRMREQPPEDWPSLLLMLGDQVYADDASPQTRAFIRSRRSKREPPGEEMADFEEYTRLYRESWSEPPIRWLLSTVPSAMIFDDHEVIDDWNSSGAWKREMATRPWWKERIAGAFMSYWLYQHLGNLSPEELSEDQLFARVREVDDAGPLLKEFALTADRTTAGSRWSYRRQLGRSRLVVIDSRAGRLFERGRREMVDDEEWRWLDSELEGDVDHLLVGTSLPFLLPRAIHDLEGWDAALCARAWGAAAAWLGERLRRAIDLEHWAAFRSSFDRLAHTLREVAAGERGSAPASIILLSGDVHYAYLAEAGFPGERVDSRLYQAVCSPLRHCLDPPLELANRLAFSRTAERIGALLRRSVRLSKPPLRWRMRHGPYFENEVATLELRGREAHLRLERTPQRQLRLDCVVEERLT
jgi:hypothetical protein